MSVYFEIVTKKKVVLKQSHFHELRLNKNFLIEKNKERVGLIEDYYKLEGNEHASFHNEYHYVISIRSLIDSGEQEEIFMRELLRIAKEVNGILFDPQEQESLYPKSYKLKKLKTRNVKVIEFSLYFKNKHLNPNEILQSVNMLKNTGFIVTNDNYYYGKQSPVQMKTIKESFNRSKQKLKERNTYAEYISFDGNLPLYEEVVYLYQSGDTQLNVSFVIMKGLTVEKIISEYFIPIVRKLSPDYALTYEEKGYSLENEKELQSSLDSSPVPRFFNKQKKFKALPSKDILVHYFSPKLAKLHHTKEGFQTEQKHLNIQIIKKVHIPILTKIRFLLQKKELNRGPYDSPAYGRPHIIPEIIILLLILTPLKHIHPLAFFTLLFISSWLLLMPLYNWIKEWLKDKKN